MTFVPPDDYDPDPVVGITVDVFDTGGDLRYEINMGMDPDATVVQIEALKKGLEDAVESVGKFLAMLHLEDD